MDHPYDNFIYLYLILAHPILKNIQKLTTNTPLPFHTTKGNVYVIFRRFDVIVNRGTMSQCDVFPISNSGGSLRAYLLEVIKKKTDKRPAADWNVPGTLSDRVGGAIDGLKKLILCM